MRTTAFALSAAALAATASAQAPSVQITIEASHGGAGSGLTNTTVEVPVGPVYTNAEALAEVSTLYLTGATGVPLDHVTCTPYHGTSGEGSGGLPFTSTTPSRLSTNTVVVGSIQCVGWDTAKVRRAPAPAGVLPPFVRRDNGSATESGSPSKTGSGAGNSTKTSTSKPTATKDGDKSSSTETESPDSGAAVLGVSSAALFGVMGLMFAL